MKRRFLVIIVVGCVALLFGVFVSLRLSTKTNKPTSTTTPPSLVAANPPAITLTQDAPENITFTYSGTNSSIPESLPLYTYSWSHMDAAKIAQQFGFTSAPTKWSKDARSTLIWSTKTSFFSLYTDSTSDNVAYALYSRGSNQFTAADAPSARALLAQLFSFSKELSFQFNKEESGPFDGVRVDDMQNAGLHGFSFVSMINSVYPIANYSFDVGSGTVIVDASGVVRSLSFISPPTIGPISSQKAVLSVKDAISSLNGNKGILVFAGTNGAGSFWGKTPSFTSATFSSFKIVYYPDPQRQLLAPYYLFDGKATNSDGTVLDVEYAVAATE